MANKPPAFQLYAREFYVGTSAMSATAVGIYVRVLTWTWDNGPLPIEPAKIQKLIYLTPREFTRFWPEVEPKLNKTATGYVNEKLESVRNERSAFSREQSERGRKGAVKRWLGDGERHPDEMASAIKAPSLKNSSSSSSASADQEPAKDAGSSRPRSPEPVWARPERTHRPSALVQSPLAHGKCYPSTACGRGLCIPSFLGQQWQAQVGGDVVKVQVFIEAALEAVSGPVADDPLKWWRQQWAEAHERPRDHHIAPSHRPRPVNDAGEDWFEECKRLHGGKCGLSQANHRHQMARDAADGASA